MGQSQGEHSNLSQENVEELRSEFVSIGGIVTTLPDIQEVRDLSQVILNTDNAEVLYMAVDGKWKVVSLLTPTWDDIRVPVNAVRIGGASPAAERFWDVDGGTTFRWLGFDLDEYAYFSVQLPHDWVEGTEIEAHVHYILHTAGAGIGVENVKWILDYSQANMGSTFPTSTALTSTKDVQNETAGKHIYQGIGLLGGSKKTISSMITCRLERDTAGNDHPTEAYLMEVDFHYLRSPFSSTQENKKTIKL